MLDRAFTRPIPLLPVVVTGVSADCLDVSEPMVDIATFSRGVVSCDPAYEDPTADVHAGCLARTTVAHNLLDAASRLPEGRRLAILDAWRPLRLQRELFDSYAAELLRTHGDWSAEQAAQEASRFVTNPYRTVPPHSTGGAIDLMFLDADGEPAWFGSSFDEFSKKSATRYFEELLESGNTLTEQDHLALENRRVLYNALTGAGFTNYPSEWWHFDYGDSFWSQVTGEPALYGPVDEPVVE
jgi:D-alanyl-D-alanine dipeptidase